MFVLNTDRGIITLTYKNYDWVSVRTLGIKDSLVLAVLLSMVGTVLDSLGNSLVYVEQGSKAGRICKEYL